MGKHGQVGDFSEPPFSHLMSVNVSCLSPFAFTVLVSVVLRKKMCCVFYLFSTNNSP